MRKIAFVSIIFTLGFGFGLLFDARIKELFKQAKAEKHYQIVKTDFPVSQEKGFVILIMAFNDERFCQSLLSVLDQDYKNYRIVYIENCSTDATNEKVEHFLKEHDTQHRVSYIRNKAHLSSTENLYRVIHSCRSDEVVILVEGNDCLAHSSVLKRLNQFYANPDVWLTFGNFIEYPTYALGKDIQMIESERIDATVSNESGIRECVSLSPYLRTFYAGLFQRIKLQDFLVDGGFSQLGSDLISTTPMLEMAKDHVFLIPDILYLYHKQNPPADCTAQRSSLVAIKDQIRQSLPYPPLGNHPMHDWVADEQEPVDIVVFSYNRPLQLYAFLESAQRHLNHAHQIAVIYRANGEAYELGYEEVKKMFPSVMYLKQTSSPHEDFAPLVRKAVFDESISSGRFVAFAIDDVAIMDPIDLGSAAKKMRETGAYGFFFRLGSCQDIPNKIEVSDGVYAWQFASGQGDWAYPNRIDMTLYKKEDIAEDFQCMKFHNPDTLKTLWAKRKNLNKVGLCFERSKIVNLPLHIESEKDCMNASVSTFSSKELLCLFQQGLKLNIHTLEEIENRSGDFVCEPQFIKRESVP